MPVRITSESEARAGRGPLVTAIAATVAGLFGALVFAVHHFTGEGCGLVRFYEQFLGFSVLGIWLAGTIVGLSLLIYGGRRRSRSVWPGVLITVLASAAMIAVAVATVRTVWAADYSRKSTELLLQLAETGTLDEQKYATLELGNRKADSAVPLLCAIAEDGNKDINLRHIAVAALGKICTPSQPGAILDERVVATLVKVLFGPEEFLPDEACRALTAMRATSAIDPLAELLNDITQPAHTREAAARALVSLAGSAARPALQKARAACQDQLLSETLDLLLADLP